MAQLTTLALKAKISASYPINRAKVIIKAPKMRCCFNSYPTFKRADTLTKVLNLCQKIAVETSFRHIDRKHELSTLALPHQDYAGFSLGCEAAF